MPELTVLLFARVAERIASDRVRADLPADSDAAGVLAALARQLPQIRDLLSHCRVAVDHEFVAPMARVHLHAGSEVAIIPPVSGG